MTALPKRRLPALARTKKDTDLRVYRTCGSCGGTEENARKVIAGGMTCLVCGGSGRILTDVISATRASAQARRARNAAYDTFGRQPDD